MVKKKSVSTVYFFIFEDGLVLQRGTTRKEHTTKGRHMAARRQDRQIESTFVRLSKMSFVGQCTHTHTLVWPQFLFFVLIFRERTDQCFAAL